MGLQKKEHRSGERSDGSTVGGSNRRTDIDRPLSTKGVTVGGTDGRSKVLAVNLMRLTPMRRTPEGMRVRRNVFFPRNDGDAARNVMANSVSVLEEEGYDEDIVLLPRSMLIERVNMVMGQLGRMKEENYSVMVSLKLTQLELERAMEEMMKQNVLIESLREAAKGRISGEERLQMGSRLRRRYTIGVQECFYGFSRSVYDRILYFAKLEAFELCFDKKTIG